MKTGLNAHQRLHRAQFFKIYILSEPMKTSHNQRSVCLALSCKALPNLLQSLTREHKYRKKKSF